MVWQHPPANVLPISCCKNSAIFSVSDGIFRHSNKLWRDLTEIMTLCSDHIAWSSLQCNVIETEYAKLWRRGWRKGGDGMEGRGARGYTFHARLDRSHG